MAINGILSSILEKTGLRKSEIGKCELAIAEMEARIRDLHDELEAKGSETKDLERRLRLLKSQYDAATPASKRLLEAQMRSLMGDYDRIGELQGLILRNIEKNKSLLAAKRMELETLRHPVDQDSVEDAIDAKREIVADLKDEDKSLEKLAGTTYERESEPLPESGGKVRDEAAERAREGDFERRLEALIGKPDAPAPAQDGPEVSENGVSIA